MPVAKWLRSVVAAKSLLDNLSNVSALLLGGGCYAGYRPALPCVDGRSVTDDKHICMTGRAQVQFDPNAVGLISGRLEPGRHGGGSYTCRPECHGRRDFPTFDHNSIAHAFLNGTTKFDLNPQSLKSRASICREVFTEAGKNTVSSFDKYYPRFLWVDETKVIAQSCVSEFGDRTCKLYTRGASTHDDKGQHRCATQRINLSLRSFK